MKKSLIQKMLSLSLAAGCVGTAIGLTGCDTLSLSAEEKETLINEIRAEIENDTGVPVNGDIMYMRYYVGGNNFVSFFWHYDEGFTIDNNNNKEYINHIDYSIRYVLMEEQFKTINNKIEENSYKLISESSDSVLHAIYDIVENNRFGNLMETIGGIEHSDLTSSQNTKTII